MARQCVLFSPPNTGFLLSPVDVDTRFFFMLTNMFFIYLNKLTTLSSILLILFAELHLMLRLLLLLLFSKTSLDGLRCTTVLNH